MNFKLRFDLLNLPRVENIGTVSKPSGFLRSLVKIKKTNKLVLDRNLFCHVTNINKNTIGLLSIDKICCSQYKRR